MAKKLDSRQIAYLLTQKIHELAKEYAKLNGMRDDLCGCCLIVCYPLWRVIASHGFDCQLIHGKTNINEKGKIHHHCWIKIGPHLCDPTFKQFNQDIPFYIGNPMRYHRVFVHQKEITSLYEIQQWETEQQPNNYSNKWFISRLIQSCC